MANKYKITFDIEEAARIKREEPGLKHYEAIDKAKLLFKEKELSAKRTEKLKGKTIST